MPDDALLAAWPERQPHGRRLVRFLVFHREARERCFVGRTRPRLGKHLFHSGARFLRRILQNDRVKHEPPHAGACLLRELAFQEFRGVAFDHLDRVFPGDGEGGIEPLQTIGLIRPDVRQKPTPVVFFPRVERALVVADPRRDLKRRIERRRVAAPLRFDANLSNPHRPNAGRGRDRRRSDRG